jgi:Icc-related predicted phosphoesterase
MKIGLISDIHGEFTTYFGILEMLKDCDITIQLGDLGLGFDYKLDQQYIKGIKKYPNAKFIRGNHDNPLVCRNQSSYLGNFGIYEGIFFISGAWSIDKEWRTPGKDFWFDEELSYTELEECIKVYEKYLPDVVISHECPSFIRDMVVVPIDIKPSRTGLAMDEMFKIHKPKSWYFGHYHTSKTFRYECTTFKCLNIQETYILELNETEGVTQNAK